MCELMMSSAAGAGWIVIGTGVLLLILVLLAIAALAKYLLGSRRPDRASSAV